jgi:hypothetical protein
MSSVIFVLYSSENNFIEGVLYPKMLKEGILISSRKSNSFLSKHFSGLIISSKSFLILNNSKNLM